MNVCSRNTRNRLIQTTVRRLRVSASVAKATTAWCVAHAAASRRTMMPMTTVADRC